MRDEAMTWREQLLTGAGPPLPLCGITLSKWCRLLRENHGEIDSSYWLRAASTTVWSIVNAATAWCEDRIFSPKVANARIEPPLFILGHWRTGTTHLHNLMAADDRFAYPNTYQVTYPNTFLCTEAISARLGAGLMPSTRPMDNVRMSLQTPNEDEFALCGMTLHSPYTGFVFPRQQYRYDAFLTFRGVSEDVTTEWKAALVRFLKKLTWKYGRPLILKSPPHTCRIRLLLDLFPDARFVHIRRDPYAVFQSTRHWLRAAGRWYYLQRPARQQVEERILRVYKAMYEVFFEEISLIPAGRIHEVSFEELEAEPVEQMRKLYAGLGLPDFGHVEPVLRKYQESVGDYKKNNLPELSSDMRRWIAMEWRRCFDEWSYPV